MNKNQQISNLTLSELIAEREIISMEMIEAEGDRYTELQEKLQNVESQMEYIEAQLNGQVH